MALHSRALLPAITLALLGGTAQAKDSACSPDEWFCEGDAVMVEENGEVVDVEVRDVQKEEVVVAEEPAAGDPAAADPEQPKKRRKVIIYRPVDHDEPAASESSDKKVNLQTEEPAEPQERWKRLAGINVRLEGALMDSGGRDANASMAGWGVSFRYRPAPVFALDTGLDFVSGTDWAGQNRDEVGLMVNAMLYLNPRDPFQLYFLGGLGLSSADVEKSDAAGVKTKREYSYFGMDGGFGAELRLAERFAMNAELLGFIRGRTDANANSEPEFVNESTHQATNTSGGGLLRIGAIFYW